MSTNLQRKMRQKVTVQTNEEKSSITTSGIFEENTPKTFTFRISKFIIDNEIFLHDKFKTVPMNSFLKIYHKEEQKCHIFALSSKNFESVTPIIVSDILISQKLASKLGFSQVSKNEEKTVSIRVVKENEIPKIDHTKLFFNSINLTFEDLNNIKNQLRGRILNNNDHTIVRKVEFLCSLSTDFGIVTDKSNIEFLSTSSYFIFFVEVSREVFELTKKGTKLNIQKYFRKFESILTHISILQTVQEIRVVVFCRMFYPQFLNLEDAIIKTYSKINNGIVFQVDCFGRVYIDFYDYRDITLPSEFEKVQEEFKDLLLTFILRCRWTENDSPNVFKSFAQDQKQPESHEVFGHLSESKNGNLLNAINLFANKTEVERISLNRSVRGIKIIIFSCNNVFSTEEDLVDQFLALLRENFVFSYFYCFMKQTFSENILLRYVKKEREEIQLEYFKNDPKSSFFATSLSFDRVDSESKEDQKSEIFEREKSIIEMERRLTCVSPKELIFVDTNSDKNEPIVQTQNAPKYNEASKSMYMSFAKNSTSNDNSVGTALSRGSSSIPLKNYSLIDLLNKSKIIAPFSAMVDRSFTPKDQPFGRCDVLHCDSQSFKNPVIQHLVDLLTLNLLSLNYKMRMVDKNYIFVRRMHFFNVSKSDKNTTRITSQDYSPTLALNIQRINYNYILYNPLKERNFEKKGKIQFTNFLQIVEVFRKIYSEGEKTVQSPKDFCEFDTKLHFLVDFDRKNSKENVETAQNYKAYFESLDKTFAKESGEIVFKLNYLMESIPCETTLTELNLDELKHEWDASQLTYISFKKNFDLNFPFCFTFHVLFLCPVLTNKLIQFMKKQAKAFNLKFHRHNWESLAAAKDSLESFVFKNDPEFSHAKILELFKVFSSDSKNYSVLESEAGHFLVFDRFLYFFVHVSSKETVILNNKDSHNFSNKDNKRIFNDFVEKLELI